MSDTTGSGRGFGYWLNIFANLAVVAGIVFLGVELRQNSQMMRSQTRQDVTNGGVALNSLGATEGELAAILFKARTGEALSGLEQQRLESHLNSWLRYWEGVHYQYRNGLYDEVEFAEQLEAIKSLFDNGSFWVNHWCSRRTFYTPPFAAELDALLPEPC